MDKETWPAVIPLVKYEGRVYGVATNVATDAVWFNKAIFDKCGAPSPKSSWKWPQLIALANQLTRRDDRGRIIQYGILIDWTAWPHFVLQHGGNLFDPDGVRCVIDSPEAVAGIQLMHDLIYKYRVCPTPAEESSMSTKGGYGCGPINQFDAGKGAMAVGGRWWLCTLRLYKNLRLGAVEMP